MYYSGNRYLTDAEMEVNATYIYEYLFAAGWSINAIAGLLGNKETESTHNPAIWEGLDNADMGNGFSLVQWTPSTKYTSWCTANSLTPENMDSALMRILYEVANHIQWGNDSVGNPPPYSFEDFTHSTESAYTLGMNFLRFYERPLVYYQPSRGTQAEKWFTFLGGIKPRKRTKAYLYAKPKRRVIIV
jgi:hypothetical protein